ncbi:MAG: hypothetical protein IPG67_18030 [Acidobacteria bacterium]|nr:hypothetical protein [Acidobacteriota bacterium]
MKAGGIKPAGSKRYFQNVKLVGVKADPNTKLEVSKGSTIASYKFGGEFVATSANAETSPSMRRWCLSVTGIDATLYNWNDYSGSPGDYKGGPDGHGQRPAHDGREPEPFSAEKH